MPHSTAQPLPWGDGTFARFALGHCNTLVLLVHGFGGGAATTWTGLRSLTDDDPATEHADVVSYGYNSTNAPVANSAVLLRSFIEAMLGSDARFLAMITQATGQAAARDYARVFIVAHSLGAPVARRALLDAIEGGAAWPKRARLILFAPAHMGTRLLEDQPMLGGGLGGLVSTILVAWKLGRPAVDDLKAGSVFLSRLANDTRRYILEGWAETLKARQVLFGENEKVVNVDRFCEDPVQQVWPDHTHVSICKVDKAASFVRENLA